MRDIIKQIVPVEVDKFQVDVYGLGQSGSVYKYNTYNKTWEFQTESPLVFSESEHTEELRKSESRFDSLSRNITDWLNNPKKRTLRKNLMQSIKEQIDFKEWPPVASK